MKKTLKLIPAIAMLLISAVLVSTSTYAWFSMNTVVTATNMQVKAVAEGGIVIANSAQSQWTATANAQINAAEVVPTSTANVANPAWVHAKSTDADQAQPDQALGNYEDLTISWSTNSAGGEGIGYVESNNNSSYDAGTDTAYVLLNNFYIRSSSETLTNQDLYITEISVSGATNKIDAALRVLVVTTDASGTPKVTSFIFAPVGATNGGEAPSTSYNFKKNTSVNAITNAVNTKVVSSGTIGNTAATSVNIKVFMYFEGEDANCKSTNISGIDMANLALTIKFGTTAVSNS